MRTTFINTLTEMARADDRIMCVIGDTGYSVFEEFEREFGNRFINVGIAEQNFISIGAGLAAMGLKPYIYNVVSFMTLRGMEQIVLDICYQENPVVMIGVGGGFAYGPGGPTHHSLHDIAMMSEIPNMTVVCPGDPVEMRALMLRSITYDRPMYIRIGRSVDPIVHTEYIDFEIGKAIKVTDGNDATIFVSGVMLYEVMQAYKELIEKGINVGIYSMHTIKPIDENIIAERMALGKAIFTIEEHSTIGGLGDAVGRVMLEKGNERARLYKLGVDDTFAPVTGSRAYLDDLFGLSSKKIVDRISEVLHDNQ